jgi:CO dehydrogenase maturation factor
LNKSIAVAGKGGTGKSTISAMLVTRLVAMGKGPVLAIDSDPDANLGTLLGIKPGKTLGDLREDALREIGNFPAGMSKASYVEGGLHEIIEEARGFDLITMGRAEGKSCYCYLNNLIRKFIDDLSPEYAWIVIDNEAGLEHISRMTTRDIDALLVIAGQNPLSLDSAGRIDALTESLGSRIRKKYVIANFVDAKNLSRIKERIAGMRVEFLAHMPYDAELEEATNNGVPVIRLERVESFGIIDAIIHKIGGADGIA